jgi:hypothetical protein
MRDVLHPPGGLGAAAQGACWSWPATEEEGSDGRRGGRPAAAGHGHTDGARWRVGGERRRRSRDGAREGLSFGLLGRRWTIGLGPKTCSLRRFS